MLGRWPEALDQARTACDHLAAPVNPMALGAASMIEGDLLRLMGDLAGAEASYGRASEHGRDPQPGLALLRVAQGGLDARDAAIRRAVAEAEDPVARAQLLGAYVEIVLAAGDADAARTAAAELTELAEVAMISLRPVPTDRPTGDLTERELEVLALLAEGKTNRAIAEALFISEKTVATHVSHIFTKLRVTSRSAATAHAYDHGYVTRTAPPRAT